MSMGPQKMDKDILKMVETVAAERPLSLFAREQDFSVNYQQAQSEIVSIAGWIQSQSFFISGEPIFTYFRAEAATLASILGVMRSGMCWVGLDPDSPSRVARNILSMSVKPIILCSRDTYKEAVELEVSAIVIILDEILNRPQPFPTQLPGPDSIALITFTSGTTGQPKGVVRTHRDLSANAFAQSHRYDLHHFDCVAGGYSPSVMGFLRAFLNIISVGGCYRPFSLKSSGGNGLSEALAEDGVTALHIVAPVFRAIFGTMDSTTVFSNVNKVMLGGDAATPKDFELFKRHFDDHSEIYSSLGSSETGTICIWKGEKNFIPDREKLPCGIVLQGVDVLIDVDGSVSAAIPNQIGELLISSPGTALNYWGNDHLSKQKWQEIDGKRFCRTGDLVVFDEMSNIHHFGRADQVVKINGFLVDPAYIEFNIEKFPGIKEVAVETTSRTKSGKPVVEAFIVAGADFNKDKLKDYLGQHLINAAIPTFFFLMEKLPRNMNGKLMRSSLSRSTPLLLSDVSETFFKADHVATLKSIWQNILEVSHVGDEESFFEVGGDSLSFLILALEIEKFFGKAIPMEILASRPRLLEMANCIVAEINNGNVGQDILAYDPINVQMNALKGWQGESLGPRGVIRHAPNPGSERLFWCLQSEIEFVLLSVRLGESFELCGLRSLNLLIQRSEKNIDAISWAYADEIIFVTGDLSKAVYLGGNCQGSELMFQVAKVLLARGQSIAHFVMMEKFFDEPFDVPTTMLFGDKSDRNLCRTSGLTVDYARSRYPNLTGIFEINGKHGEFFSPPCIGSLVDRIRAIKP